MLQKVCAVSRHFSAAAGVACTQLQNANRFASKHCCCTHYLKEKLFNYQGSGKLTHLALWAEQGRVCVVAEGQTGGRWMYIFTDV